MPFLATLFTRTRVVILVHHVHREQWSIRPRARQFGWFMESKIAVRVNREAPLRRRLEITRRELVAFGVEPATSTSRTTADRRSPTTNRLSGPPTRRW